MPSVCLEIFRNVPALKCLIFAKTDDKIVNLICNFRLCMVNFILIYKQFVEILLGIG